MEIVINKEVVQAKVQKPKFQSFKLERDFRTGKLVGKVEFAILNENNKEFTRKGFEITKDEWNDFDTNFDTWTILIQKANEKFGWGLTIEEGAYEENFRN